MQENQFLTVTQTQKDQIKSVNQQLRDNSISLNGAPSPTMNTADVSLDEIKGIVDQAEDVYFFQTRNRTHPNKYPNDNRYSTKKQVRFQLSDENSYEFVWLLTMMIRIPMDSYEF